nr:dynamin family protein [Lysinibacillus timonensis]
MSFDRVMNSMLDSMRIDRSLHKLVPSLERLLVHWRDPLRLIIMGEFNAGKSTLINTLLRDDIIASGIVPTTAIATYIRFAKEKYIEVVYEDGKVERKTIQEMEKLSSERNAEGNNLHRVHKQF